MNYFFPTFIDRINPPPSDSSKLRFAVDSGKSALRLLLRRLEFAGGSKIAVPAFACSAVREAVEAESLLPVLFDLKEKSFWTDYDLQRLQEEGIKAVVLVHLYGFLHPDTTIISAFCGQNGIPLIHDAAQSYGIDESLLAQGDGILYSFGPGKSSTAAGGGWIPEIDPEFFSANSKPTPVLGNKRAELFLKSRLLNYHFSIGDRLYRVLCNALPIDRKEITRMPAFAKKINAFALSQLGNACKIRLRNYKLLSEKIRGNKHITVAYDDDKGQYFKMVLRIEADDEIFRQYLRSNKVPFFALFSKQQAAASGLRNFSAYGSSFIELSTEACLPQEEIERAGTILLAYKK